MVGNFSLAVFISLVYSLVRMVWVVEQPAMMVDGQRFSHRSISQTADSPGNQQTGAGIKNLAAVILIFDRSQSDSQQLVGAQGIIGYSLFGRTTILAMETIGQKSFFLEPEKSGDGIFDLSGQ